MMQENNDVHADDQKQDAGGEELLMPTSKYQRIALAAVEAARLNEEVRRKGIRLDHKVTLEALKRVDEGKVKGVLARLGTTAQAEKLAAAAAPRDMLFASPSLSFEPSPSSEEEEEVPEDL